jgi:hypothetical protein
VKPPAKKASYRSYDLDNRKANRVTRQFLAEHRHPRIVLGKQSDKPVNLKLVSAGFYDWIMQNRKEKHGAEAVDAYALPGHPKVPDEVLK